MVKEINIKDEWLGQKFQYSGEDIKGQHIKGNSKFRLTNNKLEVYCDKDKNDPTYRFILDKNAESIMNGCHPDLRENNAYKLTNNELKVICDDPNTCIADPKFIFTLKRKNLWDWFSDLF